MTNSLAPSIPGTPNLPSHPSPDSVGALPSKARAVVELARLLTAQADREELLRSFQGAAALGLTHTQFLRAKLLVDGGFTDVDVDE